MINAVSRVSYVTIHVKERIYTVKRTYLSAFVYPRGVTVNLLLNITSCGGIYFVACLTSEREYQLHLKVCGSQPHC